MLKNECDYSDDWWQTFIEDIVKSKYEKYRIHGKRYTDLYSALMFALEKYILARKGETE